MLFLILLLPLVLATTVFLAYFLCALLQQFESFNYFKEKSDMFLNFNRTRPHNCHHRLGAGLVILTLTVTVTRAIRALCMIEQECGAVGEGVEAVED